MSDNEQIKTIQQTFMEVAHAQHNGAAWYTKGDSGLYQQVSMWLGRGQAALADLEKQLAERDAALARCVGGISKAIAFLDEHDAGSHTSGPSANGRAVAALMTLTQTKAAIPASIKATAKVLEAARQLGNALHEQNTTNAYDGTWSKGADRSVAVLSAEHSLIEAIREEKEGE